MKKTGFRKVLAAGATAAAFVATGVLLTAPSAAQAPRLMTPTSGIENQLSFADLVEQVSPAVVSVNTEQSIEVERPALPEEFEEFFGRRFGDQYREQFRERLEQRAEAQGSGFFIDANGHIVTNHHVIDEADVITVRLKDGTELEAELIGSDPGTDLAVLKVNTDRNQPYVEFARDMNLRVGEWVLAVGNPFGLGGTVTTGIISAIDRESYTPGYSNYIQIDAPINRGNSGGPAFDLSGRVIGVNTAILSPTGGSVGIGFAIPADTASYVVSQLIDKGSVTRGWLGVEIRPFDNNHAAAVGLPNSDGALVVNVQQGTPAKRAGMVSGDIVLEFDGTKVKDARELTRAVGGVEPGKTVDLLVFRDGGNKTLKVKLGERDEQRIAGLSGSEETAEEAQTDEMSEDLGVRFETLDEEMRDKLDLDSTVKGVVVAAVRPGSPGAEALLAPGMIILEADKKAVTSPSDLKRKIESAADSGKGALLLRVQVGQQKDFRALPLDDLEN